MPMSPPDVKCDNYPECDLPELFREHIKKNDEDVAERDAARDMQKEMHLAIKGNKSLGIKGFAEQLSDIKDVQQGMKDKLDNDHELLKYNRVLNGFIDLVKRPIALLIALALIAAIFYGVDIGDFIAKRLGVGG